MKTNPTILLLGLFAAIFVEPAAAEHVPDSGPARFYPETELWRAGTPQAIIVYPANDPEAEEAAVELGAALQSHFGAEFPSVADTEVCPEHLAPVAETYRDSNLIVVGNLHNNRVVYPLYVDFFCGADARYPGGDGYELRTVSNPWGTGRNVILIGASSAAGLRAGTAEFLARLPAPGKDPAWLPRLHVIEPGEEISALFDAAARGMERARSRAASRALETFTTAAVSYHWTGDERWADIARVALEHLDAGYRRHYPLGHYHAEAFFRAWELIETSPVFTPEERRQTARRMLETSWRIWGIRNTGGVGAIGNTHGTMMVMTQWTATRYLRRAFHDDAGVLEALRAREAPIRHYYETAQQGFLDDTEGAQGLASLALFLRWSAMNHSMDFLESGLKRQGLLFSATYYDPLGFQAGNDFYLSSRPGNIRSRSAYWSDAYLFRLAAHMYRDPELAWLGQRFAEYGPVVLWGVKDLSRLGGGTYPPPPELEPVPPELLHGLSIVPFDARRYRLWNLGAPTRGVPSGQRMPPFEFMFDKACLRTGFAGGDSYLLLQGLMHEMQEAQSIVRYTDRGRVWLTHNTATGGPFVRNSLFLSDGLNERRPQSGARLNAAGRFGQLSLFGSTLPDFYESDWERALFWKPGAWTLVMDRAVMNRSGQVAAQSVWRLAPMAAAWNARERRLTAVQGDARFSIQAGEDLPAGARFEPPRGGMPDIYENPFILRQFKSGFLRKGAVLDFQNLLTVTGADMEPEYELVRIHDAAAVVLGPEGDYSLAGVGGAGQAVLGLDADAGYLAVTPEALYLAGVRMLRFDGESVVDAPAPVTVRIDFTTGAVAGGHDAAALRAAASTWKLPEPGPGMASWPVEQARAVGETLRDRIMQAAAKTDPSEPASMETEETHDLPPGLSLQWESTAAGLRGKPPEGLVVRSVGSGAGEPADLLDGLIVARAGTVGWSGSRAVAEIELAWARPETVTEIHIHTGLSGRRGDPPVGEDFVAEREIALQWSSDGFREDVREQRVAADLTLRADPVYKGEIQAQRVLRVDCGGVRASGLRLSIPRTDRDGSGGIAISEIEVFTEERGPLEVETLLVDTLEPGGDPVILLSNSAMELAALSARDGSGLWRRSFRGLVPSVVTADLTGDGHKTVVACSYDMHVYAFTAGGVEMWHTSMEHFRKQSGGQAGLNGSTPFAVGFWEPRPDMRRIAVGMYAGPGALLNERGEVVGHAGSSGFTPRLFFAQEDLIGDGIRELYQASILYRDAGWIHAYVVDAEGRPGTTPPGTVVPGGTPFLAQCIEEMPGHVAWVAPGGAGVYNLNPADARRGGFNALWETTARPLSAGAFGEADGRRALLAGGRDGFITVYSLDGVPLRTVLVGEEVRGILAFDTDAGRRYVVATPTGVRLLDGQWNELGRQPGDYTRLQALDNDNSFLAVTADARLQRWRLE